MAESVIHQTRLVSAAIDFGTTFSSWAFSLRHTFEKDPTDVSSRNWNDGSHISAKAPTTVLIRPDGKTLEAFGYEAENRYVTLMEDDEHEGFYFFRQFKMALFQQMQIGDDLTIEDENGNSLRALTVFSLAIDYLKEDLLSTVNRQVGNGVKVDDVTWVLTVPAIWTDSAKWFMRRAAELAGIRPDNLRLSLEPEAASVFCRHMNIGSKTKGAEHKIDISKLSPGTKYMVLDAGGGTIDITVHQIKEGGKLQEVHSASGGSWGGTKVNEAFQDLMKKVVGADVFTTFKKKHFEYYLDLDRDFETAKRNVEPGKDSRIRMKFPSALKEVHTSLKRKDIMERFSLPQWAGKVVLKMDKLIIDAETSQNLFKNTLSKTMTHLSKIFTDANMKGTNIILMVGGFSESKMLQEAVRKSFPDKSIIVPTEAGLVVLKGAVIFGHSDLDIESRISRYTYGLSSRHDFDPEIHPRSRLFVQNDGVKKVRHCFSVLTRAGEKVSSGVPCAAQGFIPSVDETSFDIKLYASPDNNPQYVDEPGCVRIGNVAVDCRDRHGGVCGVLVSLMFGGPEIEVCAVNEVTGEKTRAVFTCA